MSEYRQRVIHSNRLHRLAQAALACALLLLSACGGVAGGGDLGAGHSSVGGLVVPKPSEIHTASYGAQDLVRTGSQHLTPAEFPSRLIDDSGDNCSFTPDWTPGAPSSTGLAYTSYRFNLEGFDLREEIYMSWAQSADTSDLWVGLADCENDCWSWENTYSLGLVFADVVDHIDSATDCLTVLIVCTGTAVWELEWIQVGNPGDVLGAVYGIDGVTPVGQVEVSIDGTANQGHRTYQTSASGMYRFTQVLPGDYIARARRIGYEFAPATLEFSAQVQDVTLVDFIGTSTCTATAGGTVTEGSGPFGLPNVEMWFEQEGVTGGCFAVLTDVDGNWEADLPDGSFTATPVLNNWTFTPESRDFTVSGSNVAVDPFRADPVPRHAIDGYVYRDDGTTPLAGCQVNVSCGDLEMFYFAMTDDAGYWRVAEVSDETYTVQPLSFGWGFTPPSREAVVAGADVTVDPFVGSELARVTIDGYIYFEDGVTPVPDCNVQVNCDFGWYNVSTDSNGHYVQAGLFGGDFTVTPLDVLYTFAPDSREFTAHADYTVEPFLATPLPTYTVDGYVMKDDGTTPVAGAEVTVWAYMPPGTLYTALTDAAGHWELSGIASHTYWVSAFKQGYTFDPATLSFTVVDGDETVETFYGTCPEGYLLDGYIYGLDGSTPLPGVPVDIRGNSYHFEATTDAAGYWAAAEVFDDTYVVRPTIAPWAFTPVYRLVTVAGADLRVDSFLGEELEAWVVDGYIYEAATTIPVPDVRVSFTSSTMGYQAVTDASGHYSLPLPLGEWDVTPAGDGCWDFDPYSQQATVTGSPQTLDVFYASPGG